MHQAEFDALYARERPSLVGYLRFLGLAAPEAEDVAQEAFVRALATPGQLGEVANPRAWLRLVATRLVVDRSRRARIARVNLPRLFQRELPEMADVAGTGLLVRRAVAKLSSSARAVVGLFYLADFSVSQVAAHLGMSESAVKATLHRARRELAALVEEDTFS